MEIILNHLSMSEIGPEQLLKMSKDSTPNLQLTKQKDFKGSIFLDGSHPDLYPIDVESLICKWFGHIWSGPAAAVIQPFHNLTHSLSIWS